MRAQKNAEDTLVKYPDIACLVGLWNYNGPAILNAVRGAGKTGRVKIVCFDEKPTRSRALPPADIYGTVVQNPYEFGKQSITRMDKYLHGDKFALAGRMLHSHARHQKGQRCRLSGRVEKNARPVT